LEGVDYSQENSVPPTWLPSTYSAVPARWTKPVGVQVCLGNLNKRWTTVTTSNAVFNLLWFSKVCVWAETGDQFLQGCTILWISANPGWWDEAFTFMWSWKQEQASRTISVAEEPILWKQDPLGSLSPQVLLDTTVFLCGMCFALHSGQEHRIFNSTRLSSLNHLTTHLLTLV